MSFLGLGLVDFNQRQGYLWNNTSIRMADSRKHISPLAWLGLKEISTKQTMTKNVCEHTASKRIQLEGPGWSGFKALSIFFKS